MNRISGFDPSVTIGLRCLKRLTTSNFSTANLKSADAVFVIGDQFSLLCADLHAVSITCISILLMFVSKQSTYLVKSSSFHARSSTLSAKRKFVSSNSNAGCFLMIFQSVSHSSLQKDVGQSTQPYLTQTVVLYQTLHWP